MQPPPSRSSGARAQQQLLSLFKEQKQVLELLETRLGGRISTFELKPQSNVDHILQPT